MMFYCPVCGRRRFVHQPQFWPYRFDGEMFCSENCWICDSTRKMMERKGFRMARMKKDGTPAKKPGPKAGRKPNKIEIPEPVAGGKWEKMETPEAVPEVKLTGPIRIETPEANRVEVVETPEKPNLIEYRVTGISTEAGDFQYFRKQGFLDWTTLDGTAVSMSLAEWAALMRVFPEVRRVLGVEM